jgi:hypothetical protein
MPILTSALSFDKEASIINIIQYKNPLPLPVVTQPVVHELEYIGLWILSPGDLDAVRNFLKALLESGRVACVDPENPRLRRKSLGSVRVFDGKLRLASQ